MRTAAALLHLIIIMMEALEIDAASGSSSTLPQLAGSSSKQQQRFNGNGNGNYAYASHDDDRGPNPPPLLPLESWHSSHDDVRPAGLGFLAG